MEADWRLKSKEPGPFFHLSIDPQPISDLMHPYLGMYQIPFFGYYGPNFPYGGLCYVDMISIIRCGPEHVRIPESISSLISTLPESFPGTKPLKAERDPAFVPKRIPVPRIQRIRVFIVVSDISALHPRKGNLMNLVDHAWVFRDWTQKRLVREVPKCIIPVQGFKEINLRGVQFHSLRCEYMSMHTKGGALCISPNNHRVLISPEVGICKCWTLAIDTESAEAIVSLQWLICDGRVPPGFSDSQNLSELIARVPELGEVFQFSG